MLEQQEHLSATQCRKTMDHGSFMQSEHGAKTRAFISNVTIANWETNISIVAQSFATYLMKHAAIFHRHTPIRRNIRRLGPLQHCKSTKFDRIESRMKLAKGHCREFRWWERSDMETTHYSRVWECSGMTRFIRSHACKWTRITFKASSDTNDTAHALHSGNINQTRNWQNSEHE